MTKLKILQKITQYFATTSNNFF